MQRLLVDGVFADAAMIAGRGLREVRLPRPVRPGATLTGQVTVTEHRVRAAGDAQLVLHGTLRDDDGEVVLSELLEVLCALGGSRPDR
jgi:acyl dehydratase